MKLLLAGLLLMAPTFAQSSRTWREDARRMQAETMREARTARLRAAQTARRWRAEVYREAAQARASAARARAEARRSIVRSYRRDISHI
jgi:hypothetical protein